MSDINLTNRYKIRSKITTGSYRSGDLMRFSLHSDQPEDLADFLDFILSENDTVQRLSEFFESMSEESGVGT